MYVVRRCLLFVSDVEEGVWVIDVRARCLSIRESFMDVHKGFEEEFKPSGARHSGIRCVERRAKGLASASKTVKSISSNIGFGEVIKCEGFGNVVGGRRGVRNQIGHHLLKGERREGDSRVREGEVGRVHSGQRK